MYVFLASLGTLSHYCEEIIERVIIMHQSILPPPPPPGLTPGICLFSLLWMANSRGQGHLSRRMPRYTEWIDRSWNATIHPRSMLPILLYLSSRFNEITEIYGMIRKKFIESVGELIPRITAEKKVDLLLIFLLAVLLFSTSVRHRIL